MDDPLLEEGDELRVGSGRGLDKKLATEHVGAVIQRRERLEHI